LRQKNARRSDSEIAGRAKFGCSMKDVHTPTEGGLDFFDESDAFDGEKRRRDAPARDETPNNLTLYRWHGAIPSRDEETDLLRLAKSGDDRAKFAKEKLLKGRHRYILKLAGEYYGPSRDELIAAGILGLLEAIEGFDLRRNNGFTAYTESWIRKRMLEAVEDFRRRGQGGVTRVDRHLFYRRGDQLTAEGVADAVGCKVSDTDIALANQLADGFWHGHEPYETSEASFDEDDEGARPTFVAVHTPCFECDASGGKVTDADWETFVAYRARPSGLPGRGRNGQKPAPLKQISRVSYSQDQAAAYRACEAEAYQYGGGLLRLLVADSKRRDLAHLARNNTNPLRNGRCAGLIEHLAKDDARRAGQRLKQIGRRAYALELVARDKARIAARADAKQYVTATPSERRAVAQRDGRPERKRQTQRPQRRPRITVWRNYESTAAIAAP
jgi:hypothetical protein